MLVDGHYEYIKNGIVQIRTDKKQYAPKHRWLYEQTYGKLTDYDVIVFLDGNNRNFNISNLIRITRAEQNLMNRFYGGFKETAEENLIHLGIVRLKMARHELARKHGLLVNGSIPEDRRASSKKYLESHRKERNEYQKAYKRKKYAEDAEYREKMKQKSIENRRKKCLRKNLQS